MSKKINKPVKLEAFNEKYGLIRDHIYIAINNGSIPREVMSGNKKERYVNEAYFLRRKDFKQRVWLESHDNFFFLECFYKVTELARMLEKYYNGDIKMHNWLTFFNKTLFSPSNRRSILSQRTADLAWKFWRATNHIIRKMLRKYKIDSIKRNIEKITYMYYDMEEEHEGLTQIDFFNNMDRLKIPDKRWQS